MFRYPTNRRLEVTLRHLRGETAVSLSRETGISERHIRRWKRIAVLAIEERMRKPLTENPTALYSLRVAMDQVRDEITKWKPDFSKLDPETGSRGAEARDGHLFSVFPWAHIVLEEDALIRWRA